ncbi:putative transmembrane protein [Solenopsis invicta virus 4]|uniref:Putative transmembrane protein n=1 Tax=Solenopsis invicta virus 4 TaxID=2018500 RepID=A0A220QTE6_9VIRU|nr:putative transmembrane protein [Solenopsis invicta virus 4]ASK12190.1 putative transmembrane protein [Solenopsis invicta virus 4]
MESISSLHPVALRPMVQALPGIQIQLTLPNRQVFLGMIKQIIGNRMMRILRALVLIIMNLMNLTGQLGQNLMDIAGITQRKLNGTVNRRQIRSLVRTKRKQRLKLLPITAKDCLNNFKMKL